MGRTLIDIRKGWIEGFLGPRSGAEQYRMGAGGAVAVASTR